jgi:hypothetical protein
MSAGLPDVESIVALDRARASKENEKIENEGKKNQPKNL